MNTEELETVEQDAVALRTQAEKPIQSQAEYEAAAGVLKSVKTLLKRLDSIFDPIIKAANEAVKAARDEKKKHAEPIEQIEGILRKSTAAWFTAEEKRKAEERRKAEEEARAQEEILKEFGAADEVVIPEAVAPVDKAGLGFREVWKYEITDAKALPWEYLMPNETLIGQIVRSNKQLTNIPGVRVWAEKSVIVK